MKSILNILIFFLLFESIFGQPGKCDTIRTAKIQKIKCENYSVYYHVDKKTRIIITNYSDTAQNLIRTGESFNLFIKSYDSLFFKGIIIADDFFNSPGINFNSRRDIPPELENRMIQTPTVKLFDIVEKSHQENKTIYHMHGTTTMGYSFFDFYSIFEVIIEYVELPKFNKKIRRIKIKKIDNHWRI